MSSDLGITFAYIYDNPLRETSEPDRKKPQASTLLTVTRPECSICACDMVESVNENCAPAHPNKYTDIPSRSVIGGFVGVESASKTEAHSLRRTSFTGLDMSLRALERKEIPELTCI